MKRVIATMFLALAALMLGTEIAFAAEQATEIPLGSVYTTTRQKEVKDAESALRDDAQPYGEFSGRPVIFLVNGQDFRDAVKASRPYLELQGGGKDPRAGVQTGEQVWLGACLGCDGSMPPAFRVQSVETHGRKIRVRFASIEREKSTDDKHPYLLWAPLGKLPAGEYELEMFDTAKKKLTAALGQAEGRIAVRRRPARATAHDNCQA
jgi:hypothetical protein